MGTRRSAYSKFFSDSPSFGKWLNGELQRKHPQFFNQGNGSKKISLRKSIKDLEGYWNSLLWAITEGKQADIEVLNKTDIFNFYSQLETWELKMEKQKEKLNTKK